MVREVVEWYAHAEPTELEVDNRVLGGRHTAPDGLEEIFVRRVCYDAVGIAEQSD